MSSFKKFDQGKPKFSLLPTKALKLVAQIFTGGEVKYGAYNHMKGTTWCRYWDAASRHMNAWLDGEDLDPESGKNHLAHAIASLLILLCMVLRGKGTDNRYTDEE